MGKEKDIYTPHLRNICTSAMKLARATITVTPQ